MDTLPQLNLPAFDVRLRSGAGGAEVYDPLRRQWVALTPEEWVRQHFVNYLTAYRGYPAALMANEVGLRFNGMLRRCDTLIYNNKLERVCVVEYKAPSVPITQKVFDQIARYNSVLRAPLLMVSNGLRHFCIRYTSAGYAFLEDIPAWEQV